MLEGLRVRYMLDTNVFDRIVALPGMVELLNRKSKQGKLQILTTLVQEEELSAIRDRIKRRAAQRVERQVVPASGPPQGGSGNGADLTGLAPSPKHTSDALIGATAAWGVDYLVTEDARFAQRVRNSPAPCRVIGFDEFRSLVMKE